MTKVNPICGDCGEAKDRSEFYADRRRERGLHTYCKECCKRRAKDRYAKDPEGHKIRHRAWVEKNRDRVKKHKIKSAFGLEPHEYDAMPKVCVICGSTDNLCVDHSHRSGRVRGMLCAPCNKGLGHLRDDPTLLLRAADYLLGVATPDIFSATYEEVEA